MKIFDRLDEAAENFERGSRQVSEAARLVTAALFVSVVVALTVAAYAAWKSVEVPMR